MELNASLIPCSPEHAAAIAELLERVETLHIEEFIASGQYRGFFDDDGFADQKEGWRRTTSFSNPLSGRQDGVCAPGRRAQPHPRYVRPLFQFPHAFAEKPSPTTLAGSSIASPRSLKRTTRAHKLKP